ncbi:MAG: hypothetical protein FWD73_05160 [Polyangiaceae bacterium]|nr:hypothetical protein [Polyangiaceae bacterium]
MIRKLHAVWIGALMGALSLTALACGGAAANAGTATLADAEKIRSNLAGRDAQNLAPQVFAMAEQELQLAKNAFANGDKVGADLHADRAVAAYERATIAARLARATHALEAAKEALAQSSEQVGRFSLERAKIDQQSDDLEKKLRVTREAELPSPSGPADPQRERARLLAAKSLAVEARLLCSAARLVSPRAPGLAEAEAAVASLGNLESHTETAKEKAPIDAAARARTACLASLTKARSRMEGGPDRADQLLSELSQSLAVPKTRDRAQVDITPSRDERGVVVTLHRAFHGELLSRDAEASVKELGRVAAAHSDVGVQVVIHDADPPSASSMATDKKRGEAALRALVDGGAPSARTTVEQAGASAPLIDPKSAHGRERNARLEIVFVVGGS